MSTNELDAANRGLPIEKTSPLGMSANTETHCHAAELVWDEEMAEMFRQTLTRAIGRDCFCHEGEHCWLMDTALKGLQERAAKV